MIYKHYIITILLFTISNILFAQRNEIVISDKNQKVTNLKAGDAVRLSYPSEKLNPQKKTNGNIGIRGRIDSIGTDKIWIKGNRHQKNLELNIKDISAIKKTPQYKMLLALGASYAVLAGGAILATTQADLSAATTAFSAAAAVFPALILTTNVFYPAKPKQHSEEYKIEVVTVR